MDPLDWLLLSGVAVFVGLALIPALAGRAWRALPENVCAEIAAMPPHRPNQHLVDLELRDGRRVRKVWIAHGRYPAVLGGRTITHRFRPRDVVHAHARA